MSDIKKVLVTGGGGYVGSSLIPKLLEENFEINVLDLMIYGETLPENPKVKIFKGDLRNIELVRKSLKGCDAVIHLACISNDPSFELDKKLGKEINLDAFRPLVEESKKAGIKRFIYASSSSVYGLKKEKNVNEEMSLEPLTDYSRFEADCEKILKEYKSENFITTIIRPATVCGFSPRQRLDLVVNILTNLAYNNRQITIFGGPQMRPNIHIEDMTDLYLMLLKIPGRQINGKIFNAGTEFQMDGSQFDCLFSDNDQFQIGNMLVDVMHTPGHTPACVTYVIGDSAFIGDTLFMPDFGTARADFPGGSADDLYRSIQKILSLPEETRLFLCHDYKAPGRDKFCWETTVSEQKLNNVHVGGGKSREDFIEFRKERDKKLGMPKLIIPSIQVNMRAGNLPPKEDDGEHYLKIPINKM